MYYLGVYVGALIGTGILFWGFFYLLEKFLEDAPNSFIAFGIVLIGSVYFGSMGGGNLEEAVFVYVPTSLFWLVVCLVRQGKSVIILKSLFWFFFCAILLTWVVVFVNKDIVTVDLYDQLIIISNETNKSLPMTIDRDTRLDSTIAMPGNKFIYRYTLVNYRLEGIVPVQFKKAFTSRSENGYKTSADLEWFRKNNVILIYNYRDMDGKEVMQISIDPSLFHD